MSSDAFDLDRSRHYWRNAPSGAGKHDTADLIAMADDELLRIWLDGFRKRFSVYPEEDQFLAVMGREFAGKSMLSIGSGLGFHEVYYASHGARVTCADIAPTNLEIIKHVIGARGLPPIETFVLENPDQDLGGPYEVVFLYGSLMTMPEPQQARVLKRCEAALAPNGRIVLMLYTWEFARATCAWTSKDQFDPETFARASDPSVGEEHCPWSDWHDEAKLVALTRGDFAVTRWQYWQQDWFVWCEMQRGPARAAAGHFFDPLTQSMKALREFDLAAFEPAAASVKARGDGVRVVTEANTSGYAAVTAPFASSGQIADANCLLIEADVEDGAFSVGLLDEDANAFVASFPIWKRGPGAHVMALPTGLPALCRLILSNFRETSASSAFSVQRIAFAQRRSASVDFAEGFAPS